MVRARPGPSLTECDPAYDWPWAWASSLDKSLDRSLFAPSDKANISYCKKCVLGFTTRLNKASQWTDGFPHIQLMFQYIECRCDPQVGNLCFTYNTIS